MHTVLLNIGSNLGNRRHNLSRAVAAIEKEFGYFELSHVVETAPVGYDSPNDYLNVGMLVRSDLEPLEILRILQKIEKSISPASHRTSSGEYADREIDIDIIAIDDLVVDTPELQLPHPRMEKRRFVLEPLAEIAPYWRHPILGATSRELLMNYDSVKNTNQVKLTSFKEKK